MLFWPLLSQKIPTLGYWDIRGLAQLFRYLLKYAEIEFNDKRYEFGEGATLVESELLLENWISDKFNLGLDFPTLPYYIDEDFKLSQSLAIIRYLRRLSILRYIETTGFLWIGVEEIN